MSYSKEKADSREQMESLQEDASRVLREITDLSAKLRDVGKSKLTEVSDDTIDMLRQSLAELEEKASTLRGESKRLLGDIDDRVRANPYLFILGALGLGVLLGKLMGSRDRR